MLITIAQLLSLPLDAAAAAADVAPEVVGGSATAGTATYPRGSKLPAGATLDVAEALTVRMPDGTTARLRPESEVTFDGFVASAQFSLHLTRGEVSLDASQRAPNLSPMRFELRTPLHTVVSFRALVGVVIVDADRDRIVCERCGRGDFFVSSFDKRLALSEPGQAAIVTADGGLLGGVFPPDARGVDAGLERWVLRSVSVVARADHGDRALADNVCANVPIQLRIVGGTPPYAVTVDNSAAATIRPTADPDIFELTPTGPARVSIVDIDRRSAAVELRSLGGRERCSVPLGAGPE